MAIPTLNPALTIRRARDVEGPACRMLLRGPDRERGRWELLVAVQATAPQIAGALAFHRLPTAFGSLRLRVVRTERRRGIGTALLGAALDDARRSRVASVHAKADAHEDPDAAPFLGRHGFAHAASLVTVEGDIEVLREKVRRSRERLAGRGRIPPAARIVSFADAPRDQMARLYAEHIAHQPELAARLESRSRRDGLLASSPVVMVGDRVAGFLLWSMEGAVAHVHARIVAPPYRGRWPNTVLLAEAMTRAIEAGAVRTRFEVPGGNRDSQKLARRFRADTLRTVDVYRLDLEPRP